MQPSDQGHYTALLGSNTPEGLPLDLFASGSARWPGIAPAIPGLVELPRVLLVGVPYALKAADAETPLKVAPALGTLRLILVEAFVLAQPQQAP